MAKEFEIEEYNYELPEERIAKFPLDQRSKSKLLVWKKGKISHTVFDHVTEHIPADSVLIFNDTKVIAARLLFRKTTGAHIEIFLLHPEQPTRDIAESMTLKDSSVWTCMIGNKKKWKDGSLINKIGDITITASYQDRDKGLIKFEWTGGETFASIINKAGETPLPPYLKRKPVEIDTNRYQTIYSKNDGAVAAPTAGLHFTKPILDKIKNKNIGLEYVTLHVSAGTFKPVEAKDYRDHGMHCEQIVIKKTSIDNLLKNHDRIITVGTTSLRILESLYWYGVMLSINQNATFFIDKNLPYNPEYQQNLTFKDALVLISNYLEKNKMDELHGETEIFIYPGYKIRTAIGLFTNFHLPKSTLLLLISNFTDQAWKKIYNDAMANDYRFLSYGDSSLLLR